MEGSIRRILKLLFSRVDNKITGVSKETHKYCSQCDGNGLEDLFTPCEQCNGTGIQKKTFKEIHNLE